VAEETRVTTDTRKPLRFWDGALKAVKGDNTHQLVEQFTAEMTLVAEGLCEDQSKLRQEVDRMMTDEDQRVAGLENRISMLESALDEEKASHDRDVTECRKRLAELEKKQSKEPAKKKSGSIIRDLTLLVAIAAGSWVVVTIINALAK
jgi:hypothetical protein